MKKWIHSNSETVQDQSPFANIEIVSIVLVDDLDAYNPRDSRVYANSDINYNNLDREHLLQLSKEELESIHDIRTLRKLKKNELSVQQQREVAQANKENFESKIKDVKEVLQKLKQCHKFFVWDTNKNNTFIDKIWEAGGDFSPSDAKNIVHSLHVKDYVSSTYSYLDVNWNALLMVFEYKGSYTFKANSEEGSDVTIDNMSVYIKIDVDNESRKGYAAMSFHDPDYNLNHPYKDYPIDKE